MAPYIKNVAANIEQFSKYLEEKKVKVSSGGKTREKNVEIRMAVVEYRDITCDGDDSTKIHTVDGTPWHKSTAELIETLNIIKSHVDGGGDAPETVVDALGYVADGESLKFSTSAHKFAVVLTDAPYKEENTHGLTMDKLIARLNGQDINTSIITNPKYYSKYEQLTKNGMKADINSSNFSDELIKLADVIFKTIEKEVIDEEIKSVKSVQVKSTGSGKIEAGSTVELNAVILPADADVKKVEWVVEDDKIVNMKISKDTLKCTVVGKSNGSTVITAVSEDGGFTGHYTITVFGGSSSEEETEGTGDEGSDPAVEITVDDIRVVPARKTLEKGKTCTIRTELMEDAVEEDLPEEELQEKLEQSIDNVTFRSTNSSVAGVHPKTGKVTARRRGTAVIKTKVVTADGSVKTFKSKIYVR